QDGPQRADRAALPRLRRSQCNHRERRELARADGDARHCGSRPLPGRDGGATNGVRGMTDEVERLRVELGDRAYDILVGPRLIESAGREIQPLLRRRQVVIISDETVARHYLPQLRESLSEAGIAHHTVLLPPG